MANQYDTDARREHIKSLLDQGERLDYKALAEMFNCATGIISLDKKLIMAGGGAGFSFIYALSDETGIRYIGQETDPSNRFRGHITTSRNGERTHKADWIRSLLQQGKKPVLSIIEKCSQRQVNARERYWINHYKKQGYSLLNMPASGGYQFHKKNSQ